MSDFLLEIGTEELPADFARLVISQLEQLVTNDFQQHRLKYGAIICSSTPRRIYLIVNGLASNSEDFVAEKKGPPSSKAFVNGSPTQAAVGFAKRCGISTDDLESRETDKGAFVFGRILEKGEPTFDLITRFVPKWINAFQGKRFMRWGEGEIRFARPIRWIVSLLDFREIKFKLPGTDPEIVSGCISRGHRLKESAISISSSKEYQDIMRSAGVIIDRVERANLIKNLVEQSSIDINAKPDLTSDLLNELTDLVEFPSLIRGEFQQDFLELPAEVLSTVMKVHQRYIPIYIKDSDIDPLALDAKNILAPCFFCISNGLPNSNDLIRDGNERVLKARFADAQFFVNADRSSSSAKRINQLKKVTFSEGLGSLYDRVMRIEWLADLFISKVDISSDNARFLKRSSYLCKHDLVSHMVGEFPELQGVIGAKYLLAEGEPREVALAVLEHYLPRGQGDVLPKSFTGSALALIERIELLLSIFAKGHRPSGSSDPYALRRTGNGVLQIIWNQKWKINLFDLLNSSINYWNELFPDFNFDSQELRKDLFDFFQMRIFSMLEEASFDLDLIHAVAGETTSHYRLLSDPTDVLKRISLLNELRESNTLELVHSVVNRASKLAEKGSLPLDVFSASNIVDPTLFEKNSETSMLDVVNSLEPICMSSSSNRYRSLVEGLSCSSKVLSEFFDGDESVMVMSENEAIRNNRLNLLSILRNQAHIIADFSLINS